MMFKYYRPPARLSPGPRHTAWRRTHQFGGRIGGVMGNRVLSSPRVLTFIWNSGSAEILNEKIIDDAARLLGVGRARVRLTDESMRKTCWDRDGETNEVVVYEWIGGNV